MLKVIAATLGIITIIVILVVYEVLNWGYVCWKFWYWFILPIFPTLPVIDFWQAVGLMLFISLFKNHSKASSQDEEKINTFVTLSLTPWILLLMGYFFK